MHTLQNLILKDYSRLIHLDSDPKKTINKLKRILTKDIFVSLIKQYVKDYGVTYAQPININFNTEEPTLKILRLVRIIVSHTGRYLAVILMANHYVNDLCILDLKSSFTTPIKTIMDGENPIFSFDDKCVVYTVNNQVHHIETYLYYIHLNPTIIGL